LASETWSDAAKARACAHCAEVRPATHSTPH
jgi:hypothetical protein